MEIKRKKANKIKNITKGLARIKINTQNRYYY